MKQDFFRLQFAAGLLTGAFIWLSCCPGARAQTKWTLQTEKNGVRVYTAQQDSSRIDAIRATFEADATLSQYASIILNVADYKYWNYGASNAYVFKKISESELLYYTEAKAPWPITDRFAVLHLNVKQHPESKNLEITLKNVPEIMPEKKGFVRLKDYYSVVTVTPVTPTKVSVNCIFKVDPGGSIPAWAANLAIKQMPVKTYTNLKNRIRSQGDQRESASFISDK